MAIHAAMRYPRQALLFCDWQRDTILRYTNLSRYWIHRSSAVCSFEIYNDQFNNRLTMMESDPWGKI